MHHPGQALFHEGSKGWTCCKRRVLEFDEFMRIEGCRKKPRHLFVGSGKKQGEEIVASIKYVAPFSIYLEDKLSNHTKVGVHFRVSL